MRLGEYDTQGNPDCIQEPTGYDCADDVQEFDVMKIVIHPLYEVSNPSQHNDIALIKTTEEIKYSTYISPICLPTSKVSVDVSHGKKMTLAGWGATDKCKRLVIFIL